jgi:uncharacterized protein
MSDPIAELVARHSLSPHPEGGYFREVFRSPSIVTHPTKHVGRSASTAILFLLTPGSFSAFHRLCSDEVWHYYGGDPIRLHLLAAGGKAEVELGPACPQVTVPQGCWQAACCTGDGYSFCGCTVAPGFEFEDFELASREELSAGFPDERALIEAFTRV